MGFCHLEPRRIGLGIEFQRFTGIIERLSGITGAVVIRAEVGVRGCEFSMPLLIQRNRLLVARNRSRVLAESFLSEPKRIHGLEVCWLNPKRFLELLARTLPAVLHRKQLAKVVVHLGRVGIVMSAL